MKKLVLGIFVTIVLISLLFILSGCTLKIETTDNSVSASVDGETTEKVDGIIDWIKQRLDRVFTTEKEVSSETQKI